MGGAVCSRCQGSAIGFVPTSPCVRHLFGRVGVVAVVVRLSYLIPLWASMAGGDRPGVPYLAGQLWLP